MKKFVTWVNKHDGYLKELCAVTVYPFRNRVSVNPIYGCSGCAYCICTTDQGRPDDGRIHLADINQTMAALDSIPNLDGYGIHLFDHSDPFMKSNQALTLSLMEKLSAKGYENPINITSKAVPSVELLTRIAELPLKTTIFASISDVTGRVESAPVSDRIKLVRRSHDAGLHTILALRPIHKAWTDPKRFRDIFDELKGSVDGVVIAGLRAPGPVRAALAKAGIQIEKQPDESAVPIHDPELESHMVAIVNKHLPGAPIYRKRACAVNRKYMLSCFPPSAKNYPWPSSAKLSTTDDSECTMVRDYNGYCHLIHRNTVNDTVFTTGQAQAMETLSLLFDASPSIPWCVVGGAAKVIQRVRSQCNDIDIQIPPDFFDSALQRLRDSGRGLRIRNCSGCCSSYVKYQKNESPFAYVTAQDIKVAIAMIGSVQIDLASFEDKNYRKIERIRVGSFAIPFQFDEAA